MAGEWIKMRVMLASDPKLIAMAGQLALERRFMSWMTEPIQAECHDSAFEHVTPHVIRSVTVTALLLIWGVASDRGKRDGERDMRVTCCTLDSLEEICGVPGIGVAMEFVGWVREDGNSLIFPNFCEDNSIVEDRRKISARERQRLKRERDKVRDVSRVIERDSHAKSHAREEKIREEKKRTNTKQRARISDPLPPLRINGNPIGIRQLENM